MTYHAYVDVDEGSISTSTSGSDDDVSSKLGTDIDDACAGGTETDNDTESGSEEEGCCKIDEPDVPNSDPDDNTLDLGTEQWTGFKIVGDNIDLTVKPRYMRQERQATSLHYFHSYAVKDRIDFSTLSGTPTIIYPLTFDVKKFLPSIEDNSNIESHMTILFARALVTSMPYCKNHFSRAVIRHIPHQYSAEMARKSCVVSSCTYIYYVN